MTTTLNQGVLDAFAFSPDSQFLAGVRMGDDKIVRVWPLTPAPHQGRGKCASRCRGAVQTRRQVPPAGPGGVAAKPAVAQAAAFDACTLVTQAEAEAMLGAPVVTTDNQPTACGYHAADGSSVGIDSAGGASADYSKQMFDMSHEMVGPTIKDVPGLGDKAFSSGIDEACCALYVLKGCTFFPDRRDR